jgi:hypothetical protein
VGGRVEMYIFEIKNMDRGIFFIKNPIEGEEKELHLIAHGRVSSLKNIAKLREFT